jgi:hypothetical protein
VIESGLVMLDILYALPVDDGEYTCRLSNRRATVDQRATLHVIPKDGVVRGSQMPQVGLFI